MVEMDWYALYVVTGKEELVQDLIHKLLNKTVIKAVVPKRKLQERRQGEFYEVCKTMFPGYVFINTNMNVKTYYELKQIPMIYRLLSSQNSSYLCYQGNENNNKNSQEQDMFTKIDYEEISLILKLINNMEIVDYSSVYIENARVIVCDGPLKGREGIIKKVNKRKKRARISLQLLNKEICLDVGIEFLKAPIKEEVTTAK